MRSSKNLRICKPTVRSKGLTAADKWGSRKPPRHDRFSDALSWRWSGMGAQAAIRSNSAPRSWADCLNDTPSSLRLQSLSIPSAPLAWCDDQSIESRSTSASNKLRFPGYAADFLDIHSPPSFCWMIEG
jgi:hypothetical protein